MSDSYLFVSMWQLSDAQKVVQSIYVHVYIDLLALIWNPMNLIGFQNIKLVVAARNDCKTVWVSNPMMLLPVTQQGRFEGN